MIILYLGKAIFVNSHSSTVVPLNLTEHFCLLICVLFCNYFSKDFLISCKCFVLPSSCCHWDINGIQYVLHRYPTHTIPAWPRIRSCWAFWMQTFDLNSPLSCQFPLSVQSSKTSSCIQIVKVFSEGLMVWKRRRYQKKKMGRNTTQSMMHLLQMKKKKSPKLKERHFCQRTEK